MLSAPTGTPDKGTPDEFVEGFVAYIADLERREQHGESLSDEEHDALIGCRACLAIHKFVVAVEEAAPEKIETIHGSEQDHLLTQAVRRHIHREWNGRRRPSRVVAVIAPRARDRERRPATCRRTASSSTTSGTDPGDPDSDSAVIAALPDGLGGEL